MFMKKNYSKKKLFEDLFAVTVACHAGGAGATPLNWMALTWMHFCSRSARCIHNILSLLQYRTLGVRHIMEYSSTCLS